RLDLTRLRILRVHDGVYADPNLAGRHEVGDARVRDLGSGEAWQHGGEDSREGQLFHLRLHGFRCARKHAQTRAMVQDAADWQLQNAIVPTGMPERLGNVPTR